MAQQLFTTTDGLNCRPVNQLLPEKGLCEFYSCGNENCECDKYHAFEKSVQTYPILSDKPIEAGQFEGELVWQNRLNKDLVDAGIEKEIRWGLVKNVDAAKELYNDIPDALRCVVIPSVRVKGEEPNPTIEQKAEQYASARTGNIKNDYWCALREAVLFGATLPEPMTAKPEQTNLSVEEITRDYFKDLSAMGLPIKHQDIAFFQDGFSQGHTHALASANLVELERVVEVLERWYGSGLPKGMVEEIKLLKQVRP